MSKFIAGWLGSAAEILEAEFSCPVDLLPGASIGDGEPEFTLMVDIAGDWGGTFTVTVDRSAVTGLLAEARERQKATGSESPAALGAMTPEAVEEEWQRLFRRICIAAAEDLGRTSGAGCEVAMISPGDEAVGAAAMGYQLRAGGSVAALMILDLVEIEQAETAAAPKELPTSGTGLPGGSVFPPPFGGGRGAPVGPNPSEADPIEAAPIGAGPVNAESVAARGVELLLGVELEASLRFGSREMALSDLLALGPGDVIQLDRALDDPVDLIIGDKIVARGEVVLVNGNFGLQVTEVAEPRKSLETIRCLF